MTPRTVTANAKVEADRGRIAVERGPLVYCAEWPDNNFDVFHFVLPKQPSFTVTDSPKLMGGLKTISTSGQCLSQDASGRVKVTDAKLTLIPYYAWNHRGAGRMEVWMASGLGALEYCK